MMGVASHHHTAAIAPRDMSKSASGVRREIGSILRAGGPSISRSPAVCQEQDTGNRGPLLPRLYHNAIKLWLCWTKSEMSVMGIRQRLRLIGDLFERHQ